MVEDIRKFRLTCDWPNCERVIDIECVQGVFKLPVGWSWSWVAADLQRYDVGSRLYCDDRRHVR